MKHARTPIQTPFVPKLAIFIVVSFVWLVFDRLTKLWANTAQVGDVLVEDVLHLFEFRLVHNKGAAWGILSDSTLLLGIFSLAVCLFILVMLFTYIRIQGTRTQSFFLALVFAGGLGNAIDRLYYGYVVDFINTTFISFPVFNVADIGVTCGITLLLLALFSQGRNKPNRA